VKPLDLTQKRPEGDPRMLWSTLGKNKQRETDQRNEEMELRKKELEASVKQQKQQYDMMKKFMAELHQQTQMLLSLLVQKK